MKLCRAQTLNNYFAHLLYTLKYSVSSNKKHSGCVSGLYKQTQFYLKLQNRKNNQKKTLEKKEAKKTEKKMKTNHMEKRERENIPEVLLFAQ